jgi:CRISPR/Cas system CSM-associated protein Csm3 (group 7 of RAMP superfamily)
MHKRLLNEAVLELTIKPEGPILVKAGDTGADPTRPDMEFVRTWRDGERTVYLPGPSLKGVLRSHCERIVRTMNETASCNPVDEDKSCVGLRGLEQKHDGPHVHSRSCFICQMFGNTTLAGHVRTADAYPPDPDKIRTEERNGVAIDRVFGSVAHGPFQMEVLTEGDFKTTLSIRNFTIAQLGLLALALRDVKLGRVGLGFGKSRGLGHVTLDWGDLTLRYHREPEDATMLVGAADLLDEEEAREYGYLRDKPKGPYRHPLEFGYASPEEDRATLPEGLALEDNGWGEWELVVGPEVVEEVWRKCVPAWKASVGLDDEGGA